MYDIEGGTVSASTAATLIMSVVIIILLMVIIFVYLSPMKEKVCPEVSGFANDYGIGQRRDVIAAIPTYEEESLQQKVDRWSAPNVSNLTGSRDIPVFFQDYDVETGRKGTGAISNTREGFEGGRADTDLERALSGH